ncbi:MAG: uroporphyrinogen decarboxylase [Verrucomicrobiia bacterium]
MNRAASTMEAAGQDTTAPQVQNDRERFLRACRRQPVDRPPVWLMRQAGRVLPEYRALKEKRSFAELIGTPELAAEVTLQPIRRFGFDAAILFSDILIVPQAMGQSFRFRDQGGGVEMEFAVRSPEDVTRLDASGVADRLSHVGEAVRLVKAALGGRTALIGFAGSPWTLANFMMEGGSAKEFGAARRLFYESRPLFDSLSEKLAEAVTECLRVQIAAGAEAVQIFDSLGGLLGAHAFEEASGRWIRRIVQALGGEVPVIVFARGAHGSLDDLRTLGADVLGMDWTVPLSRVRQHLDGAAAIQGNLDPVVLETTPEAVSAEAAKILAEMRGFNGHIFNLGHGVPPGAKLECIESLLNEVRKAV